jgi:phosphatidylserine/phosphatidylglycerophosphate/cardiolipin synthase-like enzyme
MQSELLRENWKNQLGELFHRASERVLISSPFVSQSGVDFLVDHLPSSVRDDGSVQVLANLSPQNIVQGATEPESLQQLHDTISETVIHHLPGLHAKVYVADTQEAIVTSGNLTAGGLEKNYEYGVVTNDEEAIAVIRDDLEEYAGLGAQVGGDELKSYIEAAREVRTTFREQQQSQEETARQNFEEALAEARDELIQMRLRGESTNATFAKTILYLLRRKGPMATKDLHPHIQRIHPDLCDDSVDRIVEGENYGKRWKHRVRAAQSTLKQRGDIELDDGQWKLAGN